MPNSVKLVCRLTTTTVVNLHAGSERPPLPRDPDELRHRPAVAGRVGDHDAHAGA